MPAPVDQFAVIDRYRRTSAELRRRTLDHIDRAWRQLNAYRDPDIDRFASAVAPVADAAQRHAGALTDAYLAQMETAVTGATVAAAGVPAEVTTTAALRGVETVDLFRRAGVDVHRALADGRPLQDAAAAGVRRARSLAATNLQLARTHSARYVMDGHPLIVGHRRVPRGAASCALCLVASTQRYRTGELQPIHPGCDCGVLPIYGDDDPGLVIDERTLAGAYDALTKAGTGRTADEARQVIVAHQHGEIGPVLAVRGQHFTGPNDIG